MAKFHYARPAPGEIWHILDPEPIFLVSFCEKLLGQDRREKHSDTKPKGVICQRCQDRANDRRT